MSEAPADEPRGNPSLEPWLPAIRAAVELGITDVNEIRAVIESTEAEDIRGNLNSLAGRMIANAEDFRELLREFHERTRSAEGIAAQHARVQYALLGRLQDLAEQADAETVVLLADAYMRLPRPYEDKFTPSDPDLAEDDGAEGDAG